MGEYSDSELSYTQSETEWKKSSMCQWREEDDNEGIAHGDDQWTEDDDCLGDFEDESIPEIVEPKPLDHTHHISWSYISQTSFQAIYKTRRRLSLDDGYEYFGPEFFKFQVEEQAI
ncbi:unnamed protein product [Arabis nemorensis]|uniref:Uncharacterized protein n=1 Tax=Arabis nemorensis TaxID=586526 RepID=A0A565BIL0_9BRAS|nr:unnamed protein product [Arabis nemorensis]